MDQEAIEQIITDVEKRFPINPYAFGCYEQHQRRYDALKKALKNPPNQEEVEKWMPTI